MSFLLLIGMATATCGVSRVYHAPECSDSTLPHLECTVPSTAGEKLALPPLYQNRERESGKWRNWDNMHRCHPNRTYYPSSTQEVQRIIRAAHATGTKVKMFGAGHSYSSIAACVDGGIAMSLTNMNRTLDINSDALTITVQGGKRLYEMYREMEAKGLAFEAFGNIMAQHIAGALSTATHGTMPSSGSISSLLLHAKLVVANGTELSIGPKHPYMDAVRTSMGALGIITEVTLQAVPTYQMRTLPTHHPTLAQGERDGGVMELSRLDGIRTLSIKPTQGSGPNSTFQNSQYTIAQALGNYFPAGYASISFWQRCSEERILAAPVSCAPWYEVMVEAIEPDHLTYEAEFAVPDSDAYKVIEQMTEFVLQPHIAKQISPSLYWLIAVRWVAAETGWLAPAYQQNTTYLTLYTECVNYAHPIAELCEFGASGVIDRVCGVTGYDIACDDPRIHSSFTLLYDALWEIAKGFNARPHPGKENPATAEYLASVYPRFGDFNQVRGELDPKGMFINPYLQQRLVGNGVELHTALDAGPQAGPLYTQFPRFLQVLMCVSGGAILLAMVLGLRQMRNTGTRKTIAPGGTLNEGLLSHEAVAPGNVVVA